MEAHELIESLGLSPHPRGGHGRPTVAEANTTSAYLLFDEGETWGWHQAFEERVWHYHAGAPLELVEGGASGAPDRTVVLGPDLDAGQAPQVVTASGSWQRVASLGSWSLVGCTSFGADGASGAPAGGGGSFGARDVLTSAWRAARHHWHRVVVAALVVFSTTTLVDTLGEAFKPRSVAFDIATSVGTTLVDLFGAAVFIGLMVAFVGQVEHGHEQRAVGAILRSLPYRRLLSADLLTALLTAAGLVAFVLPGLAVFTLLALTGPVVELERAGVGASLRRSARLVRRRPLLVFLLVTVPVFAGDAAVTSLTAAVHGSHPVAEFAVSVVANAVVEVVGSLMAVELAYRLLDAEGSRLAGPHRLRRGRRRRMIGATASAGGPATAGAEAERGREEG